MTPASAMRPTVADLRALLAPHQPPCISLYEPTHRSYPQSSRDTLDPVELPGAPLTIVEALGPELTEPYSKVTRGHGTGAGAKAPAHHGQGGRKDERPIDRERFFRVIDREILERASKISHLPLVLAALPEHQTPFRTLSHNPYLAANGIELNPGALTTGELRDAAWRVIEPYFEERLTTLLEDYGEAHGHDRGSDRLDDIAAALAQSRVGTLMLEADRWVPGNVDAILGTVTYASAPRDPEADPGTSDVLDDLAEAALRTGAEVIVLEAARIPSRTGAAAVFRY